MHATTAHCFVYVVFGLLLLCLNVQSRSLESYRKRIVSQYLCQSDEIIDKEECLEIMEQPALKQSFEHFKRMSSIELLALKTRSKRSVQGNGSCPVMNTEYLRSHTEDGERSLAPYRLVPVEDNRRIPAIYYVTECLCTYCIDYNTGRETSNFNSQTLTDMVRFFRNSNIRPRKIDVEMNVGCVCVKP